MARAKTGDPNRAVYRYNGLTMRCMVDRDPDITDGTNALGERRFLYYGAGWQVLEEFVDSDYDGSHVPDRLAQNVWGLRYVDDLVLRRVNANYAGGADTDYTDAGDTTWEQYLTDHQFSVVAAVNRYGTLQFRVAYDAYGTARHSWARDIDGDGDVDAADGSAASAASGKRIHQAGYSADADWDRNGQVNSTDVASFGSGYYAAVLPAGALAESASDFNVGFCGYRFNGENGAYTVRFRHYDPTPGMARWLERDPAGYVDGPSLYAYLGRSPTAGSDPSGLIHLDAIYPSSAAWWDYARKYGLPPGFKAQIRRGDEVFDLTIAEMEALKANGMDNLALIARVTGATIELVVEVIPGGSFATTMYAGPDPYAIAGAIAGAAAYKAYKIIKDLRSSKKAAKKGQQLVDLTTAERRRHILDGEPNGSGGHRNGTGRPGKSEFPANWSDDEIIHHISDVATDPASKRRPGRGKRIEINGTRDGIDITVITECDGTIVTGYPTNTPRNP